jgi:hypothetical protein
MNDISELWSQPWHAVQKSLAEAYATAAFSSLASVRAPATVRRSPPQLTGSSSSWLVRARGVIPLAVVGAP